MKRTMQKGFTLIELMIVVAIIGILAAVALPAYQDYTTRAKVSEVVLAASSARSSLAEAYATNETFPSNMSAAGLSTQSSKYVKSIGYAGDSTKATITVTAQGDSRINNKTLKLQGTPSNGVVVWKCGAPSDGIETKYLPASCRETITD